MNELYSEVEHTKNCWDYGEGVGIIGKNRIGTVKDKEQDEKIDSNKEEIDKTKESLEDNESRDDSQQLQINETIELLNKNISDDEKQQAEIDANKTEIIRLQGEMPKLSIEGTTMIIGQKKDE